MEIKHEVEILKELLAQTTVVQAGGNVGKVREFASLLAPIVSEAIVKDWHPGMTTNPGDCVRDPNDAYTYIYNKAEPMTHANPLHFPGASGVYHWAIVPKMKDGYKVYPDVSGIIVAVKRDECWWDTSSKTLYRWVDQSNDACNWKPGAAGVHAWVKVEDAPLEIVVEPGELPVTEPEPVEDQYPAWVQPVSGASPFYRIGDKVAHKGKRWVCEQENSASGNSYEPGVWGWKEVAK